MPLTGLLLFTLLLIICGVLFDRVWVALVREGLEGEVFLSYFLGDRLPTLLESSNIFLQVPDADLLDLASHHFSGLVSILDSGELLVVFKKECQVLERHVNRCVPAQFPLLFRSILSTRKGKSVDFVFDLVGGVGQEDGGRIDAGGHLGTRALQSRQKNRVDKGRLLVLHLCRVLATLPEVRVLINGTRNKARYRANFCRVVAKDMRERCCEGGCRLYRTEENLAHIITTVEAKGAENLVCRDSFGHGDHIVEERRAHDAACVIEHKGFRRVKAYCDDVFCIVQCEALHVLELQLFRVHELLIVGQLNDKWAVECVLQVFCELERYSVSNVHAVTAGATPGIEVEWFALLISVQDLFKVAVRKDDTSPHKSMWFLPGDSFKPLEQLRGDWCRTEFPRELFIVNR